LDKGSAKLINSKIHETLDEIKANEKVDASTSPGISVADELKKFKELLDMGALAQEEFDFKKKQLLGL
jgi:hypothetical protein